MLEDLAKIIAVVFVAVALIIIAAILTAYPVMIMWNYLFPVIFGWSTIDFWQALVLSVLCSTLFKSNHSSTKKDK